MVEVGAQAASARTSHVFASNVRPFDAGSPACANALTASWAKKLPSTEHDIMGDSSLTLANANTSDGDNEGSDAERRLDSSLRSAE